MTILYVQHDYAVFGFGETRESAIAMAAQWLKDEDGCQGCTVEYAESLLVSSPKSPFVHLTPIGSQWTSRKIKCPEGAIL